jgi:hypothetical protein
LALRGLGLALSENRFPKFLKTLKVMVNLKRVWSGFAVLRRLTLYPPELRARLITLLEFKSLEFANSFSVCFVVLGGRMVGGTAASILCAAKRIICRRRAAPSARSLNNTHFCHGLLDLVLAVVGLYCVFSRLVTRRAHEIGIQMALAATPVQVLAMVARQGRRLTTTGIIFGLASGWGLTRSCRRSFYGVRAMDPPY